MSDQNTVFLSKSAMKKGENGGSNFAMNLQDILIKTRYKDSLKRTLSHGHNFMVLYQKP